MVIFSEASLGKLENLSDGWMPKICNIYSSPRLEDIGADLDGWIEPINLMHGRGTSGKCLLFNAFHMYVLNLVCCVFMFFLVGWICWPMVSAAKEQGNPENTEKKPSNTA